MKNSKSGAFTLIDLVAVLGCISLLGLLLITAEANTGTDARVFQCRNNMRQLGAGWLMYAHDHQGRLVYNQDGYWAGKNGRWSWVGGWLDYTASPDNTNVNFLINPGGQVYGGLLGPYVRSASIFRCPSDTTQVRIAGSYQSRVRSVSMNCFMGEASRSLNLVSRRYFYGSLDRLAASGPSRRFVITEEHPGSINDGVFFVDPHAGSLKLIDFPAYWHGGSGNLIFADGHVLTKPWLNPRTKPPVTGTLTLNVDSPGNQDVIWLNSVATDPR